MTEHRVDVLTVLMPAPTEIVWELLVRADARGLWQPAISSAELLSGTPGDVDCEYALNSDSEFTPLLVIERLLLSKPPSALQSLRHYPGLDCYTDYRLSSTDTRKCRLHLRRQLLKPAKAVVQDVSEDLLALLDLKHEQQALSSAAQLLFEEAVTTCD